MDSAREGRIGLASPCPPGWAQASSQWQVLIELLVVVAGKAGRDRERATLDATSRGVRSNAMMGGEGGESG